MHEREDRAGAHVLLKKMVQAPERFVFVRGGGTQRMYEYDRNRSHVESFGPPVSLFGGAEHSANVRATEGCSSQRCTTFQRSARLYGVFCCVGIAVFGSDSQVSDAAHLQARMSKGRIESFSLLALGGLSAKEKLL